MNDFGEHEKRTHSRLEYFTTPTGGYGPFVAIGLFASVFIIIIVVLLWKLSKRNINSNTAGAMKGLYGFFSKKRK
jgi:uncharacterized membrane protein